MADLQKYGRTENLFDYQTMKGGKTGYYLDASGNEIQNTGYWSITKYIPVDGTTFTLTRTFGGNAPAICLYDTNKNFITGLSYQGNQTVTISSNTNAAYIRFSYFIGGPLEDIAHDMLNIGSTALPYQPYLDWLHSLRKLTTATEAVENPLYSDGTAITAYTLKGNTVQNGTPTPSNPVDVQGVGERTENLLDMSTVSVGYHLDITTGLPIDFGNSRMATLIPIDVSQFSAVTLAYTSVGDTIQFMYSILDGTDTLIERVAGKASGDSIDVSSATKLYIAFYRNTEVTINSVEGAMLNTGSTAKPYEPYGYKIPISNGQQTIDIYIGDLPLLKSLDGTAFDEISNGTLTRRVDSDGSVLPTPTTTQITTPSIPTIEGANSISVDTTVQPSEFTATWTGWHNANVKEWDGSEWQ